MIITCTECKKQFVVPDGAIPSEGRTVQCSSCSNEWKQFPLKKSEAVKKATSLYLKKTPSPTKRKTTKKSTGPIPYSKEYMKQKWGSTVQNYAGEIGLSKKVKKIPQPKKPRKQKSVQIAEKPGFGFFNYIITISILSTFFIGILNFERARIARKFPFLEPYIDHFFESLDIFKIFILDLYR